MPYVLLSALLLLTGLSGPLKAHSLSPGLVKVRAVDGLTQFRLTAMNRFDRKATFAVTAYTDNTLTEAYPDYIVSPGKTVNIGPGGQRSVLIRMTDIPEDVTTLYMCTETTPNRALGEYNTAVVTRVCSKIMLRHMRRNP